MKMCDYCWGNILAYATWMDDGQLESPQLRTGRNKRCFSAKSSTQLVPCAELFVARCERIRRLHGARVRTLEGGVLTVCKWERRWRGARSGLVVVVAPASWGGVVHFGHSLQKSKNRDKKRK